jgi:hypothetical protein
MKLISKKQTHRNAPVSKKKAILKKLIIPTLVISIFSTLNSRM